MRTRMFNLWQENREGKISVRGKCDRIERCGPLKYVQKIGEIWADRIYL